MKFDQHDASERHKQNGARYIEACSEAIVTIRAEMKGESPADIKVVINKRLDQLLEKHFRGCGCPHEGRCGLCEGTGYQRFMVHCPTYDLDHMVTRPCACSDAPEVGRASDPFMPPRWTKGADGVWSSDTEKMPCHCRACRPDLIPKDH